MSLFTWNMKYSHPNLSVEEQWNRVVRCFFLHYGARICCLQECKSVPESAHLINQRYGLCLNLQLYRWDVAGNQKNILFCKFDANGNDCNLAIVSCDEPNRGFLFHDINHYHYRPMIGMTVNKETFFNIHASGMSGLNSSYLVNRAFRLDGNIIVSGSYNCHPEQMSSDNFVVCPSYCPSNSIAIPYWEYHYAIKNFGSSAAGRFLSISSLDNRQLAIAVRFS